MGEQIQEIMKKVCFDIPEDSYVMVAMSGGVDSSTVAAVLKDRGFHVNGVTLHLQTRVSQTDDFGCDRQAIEDARRVAGFLGIEHHILDFRDLFYKEVVDPFVESYLHGRTPIPCAHCNRRVKFGALLDSCRSMGADILVTGHYILWRGETGIPALYRAIDDRRDQSYFLGLVKRDQLRSVRFPLGNLTKDETRLLASHYGLPVASKPDSQDICFVPEGSYTDVIFSLRPRMSCEGNIVDEEGAVLGTHKGLEYYTVGQRRGLSIGGSQEPLYVIRLDPKRNEVIVGPRRSLWVDCVYLKDINWLLGDEFSLSAGDCFSVLAKVRSMQPLMPAMLYCGENGEGHAIFEETLSAVAPGQLCGFYEGERLLGGGIITHSALKGKSV